MFPSGVPDFRFVPGLDRVASGRRPSPDGLNSLADLKYQAVLFVRDKGESDTPDPREVEKKQLRYLTIEIDPQNFAATVELFTKTVQDTANHPLLVYDAQENRLTGALWYVYFRKVRMDSNDSALVQARGLGLKENGTDPLWVAIGKYLSPS
jgi:hypothetical protein